MALAMASENESLSVGNPAVFVTFLHDDVCLSFRDVSMVGLCIRSLGTRQISSK